MPTYQYECDACNHSFEILQTMLDKRFKKCPECGKNTLHRLIGSGSGIIFKGSGFYETDYKKRDHPQEAGAQSASGTKGKTAESNKGPEPTSQKESGTEKAEKWPK